MDVIKEISESNNRDLVVQLDKSKSWLDHIRFFENLKSKDLFFEHKINDKPKSSKGCKCYLAYKSRIQGWVEIYSIEESDGNIILKMFPYFNVEDGKMDVMSFSEPYRYFYNNSYDQ